MKRNNILLPILLVLLALMARLAFTLLSGAYGQIINSDGERYARIALSLLAGDGYAWGPGQPTAHRPFGYPWLLAAIVEVFGPSMAAVQWVQAVLGSLVVLPTYALARRLGGIWAGALAGLAVALHPVLIYLAGLAAPDAAALACEMGLVWCAWIICRDEAFQGESGAAESHASHETSAAVARRGGNASPLLVWAGFIVCGAAGILLRPELLIVVWLLPLAARYSNRKVWAAATLATALAVLPVTIRNAAIFGEFIPFPTTGGVTFWCGNNAGANGGCVNPSAETWPDATPPDLGTRGWRGLTETQSQARFYRAAFEWLRSNPAASLRLLPEKLLRSWTMSYGDEARVRGLPAAADWLHGVFGLAALVGAVSALRRPAVAVRAAVVAPTGDVKPGQDRLLVALLLALAAAWLIKTIVFYGSARQTAAVLPVAAIFAAVGIVDLTGRMRRTRFLIRHATFHISHSLRV